MGKYRISLAFIFFIAASFLLLILANGCGKPVECKISSDCSQKTCSKASCVGNQCKYNPVPNCCGNKIKEDIEDDKPGNSCTCPADYGKCEGKAQVKSGSRAYDAQYIGKLCVNDACIFGINPNDVRPVTLLDETELNLFTLETTATYNGPFDVAKDTFAFRISLKDYKEGLVLPVELKKILLRNGEVLLGEKEINFALNKIGEVVTVNVPVDYRLQQAEEAVSLAYQINYEYTQKVRDQKLTNGSYSHKDELLRDDYQRRFATKITFVRSGAAT